MHLRKVRGEWYNIWGNLNTYPMTLNPVPLLVLFVLADGGLNAEAAILSEVETDLDVISDQGVDTDTDVEGRPATRCSMFDALDGLPHPFWGVETEQSSWVSLPNSSKLEPECKVLHM